MAYLLAAGVAMALGLVLGMIPVVNENLHWNLWFVVPISGLIVGAGLGWVQFWMARRLHAPITTLAGLLLGTSAMLGYFGTDVGLYWTMKVPVPEVGEAVPIREFVTLGEYLDLRLGSATIGNGSEPDLVLGRTSATVSFFVDLLGALAGAAGMLFVLSEKNPYCDRCARYRDRAGSLERQLGADAEECGVNWAKLDELAKKAFYRDLVDAASGLPEVGEASPAKVLLQETVCSGCGTGTILGSVHRRNGKNWKDASKLTLRAQSGLAEAPRLTA